MRHTLFLRAVLKQWERKGRVAHAKNKKKIRKYSPAARLVTVWSAAASVGPSIAHVSLPNGPLSLLYKSFVHLGQYLDRYFDDNTGGPYLDHFIPCIVNTFFIAFAIGSRRPPLPFFAPYPVG